MAYSVGHLTQSTGKTKAKKLYQPKDSHRHSKLYCLTQPSPSGKKHSKTTHFLLYNAGLSYANKKSTQTTETTFPTDSKNQRKKGYIPKVWEKETSNAVS